MCVPTILCKLTSLPKQGRSSCTFLLQGRVLKGPGLVHVRMFCYIWHMEGVYIGTCSWKYPSWEGLVYTQAGENEYLAQYQRTYRTVEVDQWFWSLGRSSYGLPDSSVVVSYDKATDPSFRFTIKCPNTLTQVFAYQSKDERNQWFLDAEVFYQFLESLTPLMPKIGMFMFQFSYLNQRMTDGRDAFLEQFSHFISLLPDSLPYGLEIRNPAWIDIDYLRNLEKMRVSPILLSGYWMEDLAKTLALVGETSIPQLCVRLHGDDRSGIEQATGNVWNALVQSKQQELEVIAPLLFKLAKEGRTIFVNVNNHYEGSAPLSIEKLMALLERKTIYE